MYIFKDFSFILLNLYFKKISIKLYRFGMIYGWIWGVA